MKKCNASGYYKRKDWKMKALFFISMVAALALSAVTIYSESLEYAVDEQSVRSFRGGDIVMRILDYPEEAPRGYSYTYEVGAKNIGDESVTVTHVLAIISEGWEATRELKNIPFVLHPNQEGARTVMMFVPNQAPLGTYAIATVFYNGEEELARESFSVEVVE